MSKEKQLIAALGFGAGFLVSAFIGGYLMQKQEEEAQKILKTNKQFYSHIRKLAVYAPPEALKDLLEQVEFDLLTVDLDDPKIE